MMNKCASCHYQGGIAPFPLTSYQDIKSKAKTIEAVVELGYMPPWQPTPGFGDFFGDRKLSEKKRKLLLPGLSRVHQLAT